MLWRFAVLCFLCLTAPGAVWANADAAARIDALKVSEAALGRKISDHVLHDAKGNEVRLSELLGRPLVISLIYTSCVQACPIVTQSLLRAAEKGVQALGGDAFTVVTIGFDAAADSPEALEQFAHKQGAELSNWRFLAADAETAARITEETGFTFFRSSRGFDHITQTTLLDKEGKVFRQIYGDLFDPPVLVEPLKDLILGRGAQIASVTALVDRVRYLCTLYDPVADRYRFDYSLFVEIGIGVLGLGTIIYVLIRAMRQTRKTDGGTPHQGAV